MGRRRLIAGAFALALGCGVRRSTPAPDEPTAETSGAAEPARAPRASRVRVRVIRVSASSRGAEQARERATMLARAARTDDFSALAASYGDGDRATELGAGGMEVRQSDATLPPAVRDAALSLAIGEVSHAIDAGDAFWILQRIE